jgi:3-hydroxyacyl-[acyl-carrier-protein] dehydratase
MSLTPHGPGFSFVDSFELIEPGKRGRGRKWLDPAAPFFADHFPGNPLMPGVLLIECAAQTAGALWRQPSVAFLAAVTQFRFIKPVLPNQTLEIEVTLEKDFGALAQFDAVLRVGPDVVAQGRLTLSRSRSSAV